jgi:hypothetical protein
MLFWATGTDRTVATTTAGKLEPRNPKICLMLPPVIPRRVPSFRSPQADSRSKPWGAEVRPVVAAKRLQGNPMGA